jgi:seryl-tRNA synthetase
MLDLRFVRENPELVREAMRKRDADVSVVDEVIRLDEERRSLLQEVEPLRSQRTSISKKIGRLKDKTGAEAEQLKAEVRDVSRRITELDSQLSECEESLNDLLLNIPNTPHPSVPIGESDEDNVEIRRWGTPTEFDFEPLPHWEIGERLRIIDFERGVKLAESRFYMLKGLGARLEMALIHFMLDLQTNEHGYTQIVPPFLVNSRTMTGSANLPKFERELYRCRDDDLYLIPTAEVCLVNIHMDEILDADQLPLCYTAYTPCFRREAGAAGRDVRGLIRVHQFNKVELVKLCPPETSYQELESMVRDAEEVVQRLELPYRVVAVCTGDMGFASAKTYDIEVWLPGQNTYREISSCSNCEDFQARRGGVRYRPAPGEKPRYVHGLNGSGIAVGRAFLAILENYQQADGSVVIPEALRPYMGGLEVISASAANA